MVVASLFTRRLVHRISLPLRGLSIGVRGIVQDADGRILLVRHTYVSGWHFPGGGVNGGETAANAVEREIAEETGVALVEPAALAGVYLNRRLSSRDHVLLFRCGSWRRERDFRPGLEIAEAKFFPLDSLPDALSRGTARRVAEIFLGEPMSSEW